MEIPNSIQHQEAQSFLKIQPSNFSVGFFKTKFFPIRINVKLVCFTKVIPLAFIQIWSYVYYCALWKAWRSLCSQISTRGTRLGNTQGCVFKGREVHHLISAQKARSRCDSQPGDLCTSCGLSPHHILSQALIISSPIYRTYPFDNLQIPCLWKMAQVLYRMS